MQKILIAEDDVELRELFAHVLQKNGYITEEVSNGQEALQKISLEYFDLLISDIMMPLTDGYQLLTRLREAGNTMPVLIITAKESFTDLKQSFVSGTDDFMVKPVNINEMLLRVSALLRRSRMINERRLVLGSTVMECDSLTVTENGKSTVLPQKEFMILYKMAAAPGRLFTRQQLKDDIWGDAASGDTHTIDVHVGRLRERFRENRDFQIVTIRGVGYKVMRP